MEHYFCVCSECSDQEFSCSVDPHFSKQKEYPCKVVDKHRLIERYTRPEHQLTASLKEMIIKPLL